MESEELSTIDILLVIIIAFLLSLLGFLEYENRKERAKMLNLIVARNAQEAATLTFADSTKIIAEKPAEASDLIPTDELNQGQFDSMIEHENRVVEETAEI